MQLREGVVAAALLKRCCAVVTAWSGVAAALGRRWGGVGAAWELRGGPLGAA